MDYNQLLEEIKHFIFDYFNEHYDDRYVYHSRRHTEDVVKAASEIANHFQLSEKEYFIVVTAAWFHDIGYMVNAANHEQEGAAIAASYLSDKGISDAIINAVKGCILATKLPQTPHGLTEEIVCDADLYHLGSDEFLHFNKLLRKEAEKTGSGTPIEKKEWNIHTIHLLENHRYHTDYCRMKLDEKKAENLKKLQAKTAQLENEDGSTLIEKGNITKGNQDSDRKNNMHKDAEKSIQTMFRISAGNNQHLSKLADYKAHVMVSVNSIILSVTIGLLLKQMNSFSYLIIPGYLIVTVCLLTIIFSVLATRPKLPSIKYTSDEIENKKINLLFFGNFYKLSMEEYIQEMNKIMEDPDFLDTAIMKDIYSEGVVLARKYKLLRISYDIFMYGLILSVIGFIITTISI